MMKHNPDNLYLYLLLVFITSEGIAEDLTGFDFTTLNLSPEHVPYYLHQFPKVAELCSTSDSCPFKDAVGKQLCWGYEDTCVKDQQFSTPVCKGSHKGWVKSKEEQIESFYNQGDFGYVKEQRKEMKVLCDASKQTDSSLECSSYLRFCRGRNIMMNFTHLANRDEPIRYKMDVLHEGQIGGHCRLHEKELKEEVQHVSPLQSWAPELRFFTSLSQPPIESKHCDIVIDKPTVVMKIDATVNMYHHFCDFFNLYASQHVNASHPSMFSNELHVLIWESYQYHSVFSPTWDAFTRYPIWNLKTFKGKTVCFRNIVFPLLPRMIFGLYYNTPLMYGCEKSGLFKAFSQHIVHRLQIPFHPRKNNQVRIAFLSRETTYRKVLNEDALLSSLRKNPRYFVQKVVFTHLTDFKTQLEVIRNSDVLIGMHGAGLTHLLFLPDWAAVFELYNCEDDRCYLDLARLRGLFYLTWQDVKKLKPQDQGHHPDGGAHAKFTNYEFDVPEFIKLVNICAKSVINNKEFQKITSTNHDEL
nr:PREDICTED: EGF domain-specific O-linked N-acetylglucosamine transferase isoform X1 [Bemisia tabaci]